MGHKEDSGETFGPGHDGWYAVRHRSTGTVAYTKAKSAFYAAQFVGCHLSESIVTPITNEGLIAKLDNAIRNGHSHI